MTKGKEEFISRFWVGFKWYRKYKGGTWYRIRVGDSSTEYTPFEFWDRNMPHPSKEYHETLITKEEYGDN